MFILEHLIILTILGITLQYIESLIVNRESE